MEVVEASDYCNRLDSSAANKQSDWPIRFEFRKAIE